MAKTTIPVVEERAEITKRRHLVGRVRVAKTVDTVTVPLKADLTYETVEVRRVPVDRLVDAPQPERREGDVLIIPVMAEVAVVEKRLKVVEEIHLVRRRATRTVEEEATLRQEKVEVERQPVRRPSPPE